MSDFETIVKVQLPLATNDPEPKALIYTQGGALTWLVPVTDELRELMGDEVRGFFRASVVNDGESVKLWSDALPEQGW